MFDLKKASKMAKEVAKKLIKKAILAIGKAIVSAISAACPPLIPVLFGAAALFLIIGAAQTVTNADGSVCKDMDEVKDRIAELENGGTSTGYSSYGSTYGNIGIWWPIGSATTENIEGKLFAKGEPPRTEITSPFGPRSMGEHHGIDISGSGTFYIIAAESGEVTFATEKGGIYEDGNTSVDGGYGNYIEINHGNGYTTIYGHLRKGSITVKTGDIVQKGQLIGIMGNTGYSTGMHLHFEIRLNDTPVNPQNYVSMENPRCEGGMEGSSDAIIEFIATFEGGLEHYNKETGEYTVFNNGEDSNDELTCGIAVGTDNGDTFDWVKNILERKLKRGDKLTKEEYNKIFEEVKKEKKSIVDNAISKTGAILNQQQKDSLYSFCWNAANTQYNVNDALEKYVLDGEKRILEQIT